MGAFLAIVICIIDTDDCICKSEQSTLPDREPDLHQGMLDERDAGGEMHRHVAMVIDGAFFVTRAPPALPFLTFIGARFVLT